ncbi:SixA phosphatase family protein [Lysobacter enzymogenes]|uniref:Histidine phosphatase family protein n=1 Tax=Lysobacter enzymogenes TaxID=69 RepID=A0A3N2RCW4_LYSEN|nr:histidine phosphatase family protein [Lysobacter enzymogenes]ROU05271.1 histidine phosphatase family protein [Lysobacter enzymogenes]
MDRIAAFVFAIAAAAALAGCASAPAAPSSPAARYIVVRHAEKANDDPRDPALSAAGRERAQRLAARLREEALGAVYVTGYRRTLQTGEPAALAHGLTPIVYDAKSPAAQFAAQLRRERPAGATLVVGHSNTAPDIAAALCACAVEPMPETEYDRRMIVDLDAQGRATLRIERDR